MSRLMKAFVGGACLLAGLMLLGYSTAFRQGNRERDDAQLASVLPMPGKPASEAKPAELEKPAAPASSKLLGREADESAADEPASADPNELKVRPDENGMLMFSFNGQAWPDVFEWLADVSAMSLLWEKTPPGGFTYATREPCTVAEVRDTINSILLGKGFTLLRGDEALIVAQLENLDASLAPWVAIDELGNRDKHELVNTSVSLDWLPPEAVAEEIEPLLGPYGRAAILKTPNRLELFDMVVNLEPIVELIDEERSGAAKQKLVEEFRLKYVRAAEVLKIVQALLGIKPKSGQPADSQQILAESMLLQLTPTAGQTDSPLVATMPEEESQIKLAINLRANSILATAPPDKMAVIRQTISVVDVPHYPGQSPSVALEKTQVYRVTGISPDVLVKILKELGDLDPTTHLEIDEKNRTIVAFAPPADHVLIRALIDKIDGTGRHFEVIQLHLLSAEYVAGSIKLLMSGAQKTGADRSRYPPYYYYYFFAAGGSLLRQHGGNRFQAEADVERNRLLLWANDIELAEVKTLLLGMGEVALDLHNGLTTRMIPPLSGDETEKLLERLQRVWPAVAPNPLDVQYDAADAPDAPAKRRSKHSPSKPQADN